MDNYQAFIATKKESFRTMIWSTSYYGFILKADAVAKRIKDRLEVI
jgi:hypothetical protein